MKTQIRRGVFETNSSSTHAISIVKNGSKPIKTSSLVFDDGEFGWGFDIYTDTYSKASYLWEAIVANCNGDGYGSDEDCVMSYDDAIKFVTDTLAKYGVEAVFMERRPSGETYTDSKGVEHHLYNFYDEYGTKRGGYIDHSYELRDFLENILTDEEQLISFLFDEGSYISTGNDNSDEELDGFDNGDSWDYYKGN